MLLRKRETGLRDLGDGVNYSPSLEIIMTC